MVYRRLFEKAIIVLCFGMAGCATVNVPNWESGSAAKLEADEARFMNRAKESIEFIDHSGYLYDDPELEGYLNKILKRLLGKFEIPADINFDVKVINDPDLNAFALSTGRLYVHTGILAAADNEAQVATLIGHEMTHVLHRHMLKKFRSMNNSLAFWNSVGLVTGGIGMIASELAKVSSVSGYSQDLETEADKFGFQMLMESGYDINEAPKMFEALEQYNKDEKNDEPFFFSSHPKVRERIKNYKQLIKEQAQTRVLDNKENQYIEVIHDLAIKNAHLAIQKGMFKVVEHQIEKLIANYSKDPRVWVLKAEYLKQTLDNKKEGDKILEAYSKALGLDNNNAQAIKGKARVLYGMGKKEEAKKYFQQYLNKNPNADDRTFIQQFIEK